MAVYYFHVRNGAGGILDLEGTELPDQAAAETHAVEVIRELLRANEIKKRPWRLDVCDRTGQTHFTLSFSAVDPTLDHLSQDTRELVERLCESRRKLAETVYASRAIIAQSLAIEAQLKRKPYLIAKEGQRVA